MRQSKVYIFSLYNNVINRGVESFSDGLAKRLVSLGVDISLVCAGKSSSESRYKVITVDKCLLPTFSNRYLSVLEIDSDSLSSLIFSLKSLYLFAEDCNHTVFTMNDCWQVIVLRIFRFFYRRKIKIVAGGHAGIGHDDYKTLKSGPDVFVALTEEAFNWASKYSPKSTKVVLIPVGLDIETFRQAPPLRLFNNNFPVVYCNAALVFYKRVNLVIKAVSQLTNVNLVLTGGGPLQKELTELGNKLIGVESFKCLGSMDYKEIPKVYASCDVFTLASETRENSPAVYLEAMAAGKPVVTTDFGRARWILDGAGVFVDPKNTEVYSQTLNNVLTNQTLYQSLIKAGKSRVSFFSWNKVTREYLQLISR